jgi:hypothetical protein
MKSIATALLAILASCSAVAPAQQAVAPTRDSRIALYLGQRSLDENDYSPVDKQDMFGIEYSRENAAGPVGFEVGIMGSKDEDNDVLFGFDVEASTSEFYGGIRKTFGQDVVRPYIGGGLSFINSKIEVVGVGDDDDSSIAAYLHGGIGFQISQAVVLGLDLRFLFGSDLTLAGVNTDADYTQATLFIGFGF